MAKQSSNSSGIGFIGLLTIVFITLKLTGVINWPWLWVLAPLWGSITLVVLVALAVFIGYLILDRKNYRD
jgi:sterol desaturase/sphingolipid hydroxylase (fatty acid hydroxylase superfamily)